MKRVIKLVSILLVVCILAPTQTLAYVGRVEEMMENFTDVTTGDLVASDGSHFKSLKSADGKLEFYLALDGSNIGKSVTMSARGYVDPSESISKGVYEQARFTIQTGKTQKALTVREVYVLNDDEETEMREQGIGFRSPSDKSFTVRYRFSGYNRISPEVDCYINYSIVQLGAGISEGEITSEMDMPLDENTDDNRTYAVLAWAVWKTANDNVQKYVFRWFQDYHGFSRMGHSGSEGAAHVKMSRTYESQQLNSANSTDITMGLGRTNLNRRHGNGDVSEIYSDSYGVDSPFVLAEVDRISDRQDIWPPVYMTYDAVNDCLTAEGYTYMLGGYNGIDSWNAIHVWGMRDIYTKEEAASLADVKFTDPDAVVIPQDADKLGFYKSDDGIIAESITDTARGNVLKKKYGDPVYTLRGDFEIKNDANGKYYEFTDYKVALTPTITASWMGDNNYFRVRVDDSKRFIGFETTQFVNYSTPRFMLYSPKAGTAEPPKLAFEDTEDDSVCLTLNMEPENNDVLVFIDIPEVSSKINKAQIKPDGDLVLSGMMGLDMILNCSPDKLLMLEKLGYGPKENDDGTISFVQNGIKASGGLDTGSLLGLDLAKIEAAINTFEGEEEYDFSVDLNAFELFKTAAELNLKRLYNGRLCPDRLNFEFQAEPGIPLIPPVPTSYLKGAGGGFSGLASTINGDYIAIPPIRLKLTAIGDYVKIIEGKVHITLGPSYLEYAGSDITIAEMDVLDSFNMYLKLVGEKRKYNGITYTGLRAGGGMGVVLKAPQGDEAIFEVDGNAEATVFGGLDNYKKPKHAYMQLDSRGSIGAKVMIPKQLGKLKFKKLGGKELASTTVEYILGAQTAIPVDPKTYEGKDAGEILETAAAAAWDNLSVYGGVSNKGTLFLINYRIYYIIPDKFGGAVDIFWNDMNDWSLEDEIDENAWYVSKTKSAHTLSAAPEWETQIGKCYDTQTNEQVGIAVIESSINELPINSTSDTSDSPQLLAARNNDGTYTEEIRFVAADNTKVSNSNLGFVITPKDNATLDELKNNLKIEADGTELALIYADIKDGVLVPDANITEIETEDGKNGLLVAPPDCMSDKDHVWTVTAGCDFEYNLIASSLPTSLELSINNGVAESTIHNPQEKKEYAVRYYFDTAKDRTGQGYFIDMKPVDKNQTVSSFKIPDKDMLAPSGDYYVTAVLTEKISGDFDGNGTVDENEYSWVTVDTQTSDNTVSFVNTNEPDAPSNAALQFTGNETLTASWDKAAGADGYRITVYYQEDREWKQAGGSYVLSNDDFSADSKISAASETANGFSLRMAPTVSGEDENGESDAAPTDKNYKVTIESFKTEDTESEALAAANVRYFSKAIETNFVNLQAYTAPEIRVNYNGGNEIILNGTNGYAAMIWNSLPNDTLFTVTGADGNSISDITVTPEFAAGNFTVTKDGDIWNVTADTSAENIIKNSGRIKILVSENGSVTDYYLRLALDNTAPLLTLDSENVYADVQTGEYSVTGITEPGLTVSMVIDENGSELSAQAGADGKFAINGKLAQDTILALDENENEISLPGGFQSILSEVTTQDESGNVSEPAPVLISAREKSQSEVIDTLSVTASPATLNGGGTVKLTVENADKNVKVTCNDDSISVTGSGSEWSAVLPNQDAVYTFTATDSSGTASCTVTVTRRSGGGGGGGTTNYIVSFETNGGSKIASQSVARNASIKEPTAPTKENFNFEGWYTDKELKTKYDFSDKVTKSITLYAKWTEKDSSINQIILTIGEKNAKVFGKETANDVAPKIVNDRTMLPARFVAENLGAKVDWDGEKKLVTITGKNEKNENVTILITIGAATAIVNGNEIELDSPAFVENDRTYTPIRFISEQLGAKVDWDEENKTVIITKLQSADAE